MFYESPATTQYIHQVVNKNLSPVHTVSKTQRCEGFRCNGRRRSIQQFRNSKGEAVFKYCLLCRGRK